MKRSIQNYRERTDVTQESIAIDLGTHKPTICNIEQGKRSASTNLYKSAFKNADDAYFLNDLIFEISDGYGTPTPSKEMFCDHRLSIKHRAKKEIEEVLQAMKEHRLDKQPHMLNETEVEVIKGLASEVMDVVFEMNALLMRLSLDYDFIDIRKVAKSRNTRYAIDKRIARSDG